MRFGLMAAATLAATMAGAGASQAAPVAVTPLVQSGPAPSVELVAGGCGLGFHRGLYGACRPNGVVVGRSVVVGGYHPYGWHYGWHRYGWRRW